MKSLERWFITRAEIWKNRQLSREIIELRERLYAYKVYRLCKEAALKELDQEIIDLETKLLLKASEWSGTNKLPPLEIELRKTA